MIRFLTVGPRWRIWSAGIHDGMTALRLRRGITRDPPLRHHAAFRRSLPAADERRLPAVRLPLRFAELGLSLREHSCLPAPARRPLPMGRILPIRSAVWPLAEMPPETGQLHWRGALRLCRVRS